MTSAPWYDQSTLPRTYSGRLVSSGRFLAFRHAFAIPSTTPTRSSSTSCAANRTTRYPRSSSHIVRASSYSA